MIIILFYRILGEILMWHGARSCGDRDRPVNTVISQSQLNYSRQSVTEENSQRCFVKNVFLKIFMKHLQWLHLYVSNKGKTSCCKELGLHFPK